ncbi:phytoene/squalene synthase family protein [soil metagenome]
MEPTAQLARAVRELDRDRYVADLFVPTAARRHIFALHAFSAEVARVRDMVSDPVLGEIRLQWWRDALKGQGGGHPTATALLDTIRTFALPLAGFDGLIDARVFDLYDDQMPTLNDLEGYAGETSSALIQIAAIVLAGGHDPRVAGPAGHAGVAYALTGLMRALPVHTARGQCYLPADITSAHGLDRKTLSQGKATPQLLATLAELRVIAREHLAAALPEIRALPAAIKPAFLPAALVEPALDRMDRPGYDPFSGHGDMAPWRRHWAIWKASRSW